MYGWRDSFSVELEQLNPAQARASPDAFIVNIPITGIDKIRIVNLFY